MRDGRGLNRATFRLLALVVSLGILLAAPLAGWSALAAPGGTLAGGEAALAGSGPLLGALVASAEFAGDASLGRVIEGSALDAVLAQATADMSLTKTAPATVIVGNNLVYTLSVLNGGPSAATNVTVTDLLLTGLTFVSATSTQGTCSLAGQLVTCALGAMVSGATATVTITTTPQASLAGATATNTATVTASEADPNPGNNTGAATTTIQGTGTATPTPPPTTPADMALTKAAPATATAGTTFTYTLTVTNAGPGVATSVSATDLLLNGLTFVSATPSQGTCAANGQLITCTIGIMNPGATVTIQIAVTPQASLAGATVTNTATVTAAQTDPNPGNNTGAATTTIAGTGTAVPTGVPTNSADMALTKVGSPNPVNVGNNLTYSYTIVNNGPGTATGVIMSDFIQSGLTFVSGTATQGTCTLTNNVLTCTIGTMNPGAVVTVTAVVQPQASLAGSTITNTASVAAQQPDPNPTNNSATASVTIAGAGTIVVATQTVIAATQTAIAATQTATGTGPVVPPGVNPPPSTGQPGVACTNVIGGICTVTGAVSGTFTKIASMTFNVTATGPTNTAPRGVPAVFIPTTVGVESFGCTAVGSVVPFSTVCTGTTRGDLLLGATVTVRFPLVGGGTQDVPGAVTSQGGRPQNVQQAIASVAPSGLPNLPCADVVGQTCQAVGPVQGLGAVTGSMTWNLTVNVPAGVVAGTVPVAVFSTTIGMEGFACAAVAAGATTVTCAVTTVGNALLGSNITVVFAPGIFSVGTVQGPGPIGLQALASAPPPLLPPPPPLPPPFLGPPMLPPPPPPGGLMVQGPPSLMMQPAYPGVPVVPEADSLILLGGGLLAVGAFALRRTRGKKR